MNRKVLITIGILVIAISLLGVYFIYIHRPTPTEEQLIQRFSEFKIRYQEKKTQGYNVMEAEELARKSRQAFERKDYEMANNFLDEAFEALEKAKRVTFHISWPIVRSNSWIADPVSLHEFVPLGITIIERMDHSLTLPSGEWRSSNWIPFGKATTADGNHSLVFHSSVNIGGGMVRLIFDGKRIFYRAKGPTYYDIGRYFPYPTVHTNSNDDYVIAHAYDEKTRTWYQRIIYTKTSPHTIILDLKGKGRSIPLWIGKPEGPYIAHGVYPRSIGVDCWGGYIDFCDLTKCIYHDLENNETYNLTDGFMFVDREYHRACIGEVGGLPISFSAMSLHKIRGEKIECLFLHAENPLPKSQQEEYHFPEFEHTGRINFIDRNESYQLDEFEFWDTGGLQPNKYYLVGKFGEDGKVNLTAEAYDFWGSRGEKSWGIAGTKTWWNNNARYTWGRSFVLWTGTITYHDEVIKIENVSGFGEFTRFSSY